MLSSAAIKRNRGSAKRRIAADSTRYAPRDTSIPVRTRLEKAALSYLTFPTK